MGQLKSFNLTIFLVTTCFKRVNKTLWVQFQYLPERIRAKNYIFGKHVQYLNAFNSKLNLKIFKKTT